LASGNAVTAMDERIESFLADVLALEGEDENAIRQGVRLALAGCEQIFKGQEVHRRVKARPPTHATRHAAPAWSRKSGGGREHHRRPLKLVLSVVDGPIPAKGRITASRTGARQSL